jgi:UDP-N-acetyl-alpha-D-muramoyl-L-alanyl-L-glutamate epimerase
VALVEARTAPRRADGGAFACTTLPLTRRLPGEGAARECPPARSGQRCGPGYQPYHACIGSAPESPFEVLPARADTATGRIELGYRLGRHEFTEVVELGGPLPDGGTPAMALASCLRLLAAVAGVSYYKTAAPDDVVVAELAGPTELAVVNATYGPGLSEFRHTNGLALGTAPRITVLRDVAPMPVALPPDGPYLVPVGGGKDSVTTIELLRRSAAVELFAVNRHRAIDACIDVAGLPARRVSRRLDPRLHELNEQGALNGHVPVTAIVSMLALAAAVRHGARAVVMSNERSASYPNVVVDSVAVNHQHSKSLDFERTLAAAVRATISPDLGYFSVLRPLSELAVCRVFATLDRYHPVFTSCNRVFALTPEKRTPSWCGECDKCRFVYLGLAPFLDRSAMVAIFGHDLLDDISQLPGFELLVGLQGFKPFDCVGDLDECRVALRLLGESPQWCGSPVVRALSSGLAAAGVPAPPASAVAAVFAVAGEHRVPAELLPMLQRTADAVPSRG